MKRQERFGMAIPIVLLFVMIFSILMFSLWQSRTQVRRQTLISHTQKKAYYLAMGGIQHALLKLRIFPREAYMAGSLARGVCPWFNPRGDTLVDTSQQSNLKKYPKTLEMFRMDLNSDAVPFSFPEIRGTTPPWEYKVVDFTVSSYYTKTTGANAGLVKEVVTIFSEAKAFSPKDSVQTYKERIEKQVELERKIR